MVFMVFMEFMEFMEFNDINVTGGWLRLFWKLAFKLLVELPIAGVIIVELLIVTSEILFNEFNEDDDDCPEINVSFGERELELG